MSWLAFAALAKRAFAFLKGLPRDAWYLLAIALLLFNTYGDLGFWHGWKPTAERIERQLKDRIASEKGAAEAQHKQRLEQEAKYRQLAEKADEQVEAARQDARDATDLYIQSHRVRYSPPSNPGTVAQSGDPAIRPDVSGDSFVAVSDADVQACSGWVAYGIALREWALHLNDKP